MQYKSFVEKAVPVLRENIHKIHTVTEWARALGYTRAHFHVLVKKEFNMPPSIILRREKYLKVKDIVRKDPDRKGRVIAKKAGFKNVKSSYKFLKRHFNTNLTSIRKAANKRL